jgi:acyl-CoA synthetase (NDP forming)
VRFAQVMSSGFGEVAAGRALERQLVEAARAAGVRILGPNCLGVYSPRGKVTFIGGASAEPGSVGVITQSGGLGVDIILRGQSRGLRYSGLVTIGNSADVGPADLVEYFLADPDTRVIGLYAEDIKDGRAFFRVLREARGAKPVVVLLGGQTGQGRHAAASHTGSLASGVEIWAVSRARPGSP